MYSRASVSTDSVSAVSVIRVLPRLEKKFENLINKRFMSFKTRAKRDRAVTWWNTAAQMRPVLDSSSFVSVPTIKRQNPLLSYVRESERERERQYTVNVQCSVQYTLLLLYLMLVMSYCA
jgi:hypothetical protein